MKRYAEGDEVTYGEDERPAATGMGEIAEGMREKPKSFKEAFAEARRDGDKTFTWQGKKYTTDVAGGASKAAAPAPSPAPASDSDVLRLGATAKRISKDDETKSVSERMKAARERARAGGTSTDERSVTERMGGSERTGSSTGTDTRSVAERARAARESARSGGSGTDTRSVSERVRSALGFAKGGSVSSASSRGDGCAQRGKTKGRYI